MNLYSERLIRSLDRWVQFVLLTLLSMVITLPAHAAATQPSRLPTEELVPGGIAIIPIPAAKPSQGEQSAEPVVHFRDNRVLIVQAIGSTQWLAIIGIPRSTRAGKYPIAIQWPSSKTIQHFVVADKRYAEQRIQIENKRQVNPEKRDMIRIINESQIMKKAFTSWTTEVGRSLRMNWPVSGPISSPFGLTRFFNDQPRRPHSGIDIAAPTGTPITAPKAGTVIATGDFFFNGNTVILDHGKGLISLFCHLDRIDTKNGEILSRGTQLGTVGQTGRATGPHLHWSLNLNNVRINPMLFLDGNSSLNSE